MQVVENMQVDGLNSTAGQSSNIYKLLKINSPAGTLLYQKQKLKMN